MAYAAARGEALADYLREETTGGKLLLAATAVALLWANVAGDSYSTVWSTELALGPEALHLDLSLGAWVVDGLLAVFFFVAGLELKRELAIGELSDRRAAALPLAAAAGGVIGPALIALAVSGGDAAEGGAWAVPVATDIAFALGVLALAGAALPSGVRILLLSMAVIDDLIAITLIAVLFTQDLSLGWLAGGVAAAAVYALCFRGRADRAWLLWALAVATWTCVHASGVHATAAGILLALLTPVHRTEHLEHRLHPVSAGVAVPLFALAATGISLAAAGDAVDDRVAIAIFAGLLLGKVAGILGGSWAAVRLRVASLPENVRWADVVPVATLGAIGYTVSLLIARLAFEDPAGAERAAAAVLAASVLASVVSVALLRRRSRA